MLELFRPRSIITCAIEGRQDVYVHVIIINYVQCSASATTNMHECVHDIQT